MPRKLFTEAGDPVEVPEEAEIAAAMEAKGKVDELNQSLEDLKKDMNPNWAESRKTQKRLETELNDWKKKAEAAGVKADPVIVPREDIETLAEKTTNKVILDRHRSRALSQFKDKRELVESYYNKLAAGEELDESKIDDLIGKAASLAGLNQRVNPLNRAIASTSHMAPEFSPPEDDFSQTEQGKAMAEAMGLEYKPKAKK